LIDVIRHSEPVASTPGVPRLTIGMPTLNRLDLALDRAGRLADALGDDARIVVSDNASDELRSSTTTSVRIAGNNLRIPAGVTLVRQPARISAWDHFAGLVHDRASTTYFAWVADDDFWNPQFFRNAANLMDASREVDVVWPMAFRSSPRGVPAGEQLNPDLSGLGSLQRLIRWQGLSSWAGVYALYRSAFLRAHVRDFAYEGRPGGDVLLVNQWLVDTRPILLREPARAFLWAEPDPAVFRAVDVDESYSSLGHVSLLTDLMNQTLDARMSWRVRFRYVVHAATRQLLPRTPWEYRLRQYVRHHGTMLPEELVGRRLLRGVLAAHLRLIAARDGGSNLTRSVATALGAGLAATQFMRKRLIETRVALRAWLKLGFIAVSSRLRGQTRVFLVEPCPCHLEVAEGIGAALRDRGAAVTLVTNPDNRTMADAHVESFGYDSVFATRRMMTSSGLLSVSRIAKGSVLYNSARDPRDGRLLLDDVPRGLARAAFWILHDLADIDHRPDLQHVNNAGRLLAVTRSSGTIPWFFPAWRAPIEGAKASLASERRFLIAGAGGIDLSEVLAAFSAVVRDGVPASLHVTGWETSAEVAELARSHGMERHVVGHGRVVTSELVRLAAASHFLVGPTRSDMYGVDRKVSGSRQLAVAGAIPILLEGRLAEDFGLPGDGVIDTSTGLAAAFGAAMTFEQDHYAAARASLARLRVADWERMVHVLGTRLGL
jgi:hypothetical protein